MELKLYQVDAFTDRPFGGNPAAVVPLRQWLPEAAMQAIALENNLSETAFFVPRDDGDFDLRWFTPADRSRLSAATPRRPPHGSCSTGSNHAGDMRSPSIPGAGR